MNSTNTLTAVRKLVIVGGGTSGWMAAAMLARALPKEQTSITVVEPPGPRGIGVGEASIPSLVSLLHSLHADEGEFLRRCEATYKLGIQFCDWKQIGSDYWHPFGVCGARIDGRDLFPFWFAEHKRSAITESYHSYSLHHAACVAGKGPHSFVAPSPITQTRSYAFHFNAEALAGWLRDQALVAGVKEVNGAVQCASLDERGHLTAVHLNSGGSVEGDFFIDCSGFQSILMQQTLRDPFQGWSEQLLCDRACAVKIERRETIPPFTKSLAMPAGWMWQIPLTEHLGLGYVFSSQFASDDEAWQQFQAALPTLDLSRSTPRFLKMRVGRQSSFWKNNVLALGLAAGFLEPLESTGIHLSQIGLELFVRMFPSGADCTAQRDHYNNRLSRVYDEVRDFVQLHYRLSQRTDSAFWNAARNAPLSAVLSQRLDRYDDAGFIDALLPEAFTETSYFHILTGNDRLPRRASALALSNDPQQVQQILSAIRAQNEHALRELPQHEELLNRIQRPLAKAS